MKRRGISLLLGIAAILAVLSTAHATYWTKYAASFCQHTGTEYVSRSWGHSGSFKWYDSSAGGMLDCPIISGGNLGYESTTITQVNVHGYDANANDQLSAWLVGQSPWSNYTWDICASRDSGIGFVGESTLALPNCISNYGYAATARVGICRATGQIWGWSTINMYAVGY